MTLVLSACCDSLPKLPAKRISAAGTAAAPHALRPSISELYFVWHDPGRLRDVPVKVYMPVISGKHPVVIFSHGIGEDRYSYAYLGRALAANGFISVHLTHEGTDRAVLEQGYRHIYSAVFDPMNWINRPLDVSFAINELTAIPSADLSRIAVAGHSAGAFTAFAVAGMKLKHGEHFRDDRVRAIIAMSMPRMEEVVGPRGYDFVDVPALNITGTCDGSIVYRTLPRHRRIPFDSSHAKNQYLVTIRGADHNTFSSVEDAQHERIAQLTVLFLRAFLLDDAQARAWFDDSGSTRDLAVERK